MYKDQSHFYTQIINYLEKKLRNNSISNSNKRIKTLRNKRNQIGERLVLMDLKIYDINFLILEFKTSEGRNKKCQVEIKSKLHVFEVF